MLSYASMHHFSKTEAVPLLLLKTLSALPVSWWCFLLQDSVLISSSPLSPASHFLYNLSNRDLRTSVQWVFHVSCLGWCMYNLHSLSGILSESLNNVCLLSLVSRHSGKLTKRESFPPYFQFAIKLPKWSNSNLYVWTLKIIRKEFLYRLRSKSMPLLKGNWHKFKSGSCLELPIRSADSFSPRAQTC